MLKSIVVYTLILLACAQYMYMQEAAWGSLELGYVNHIFALVFGPILGGAIFHGLDQE